MKKSVSVISEKDGVFTVGCPESACSGCKSEMFCSAKGTVFEVLNTKKLDIKEGDSVTVEIKEGKAALSAFVTLGIPLISFIPGYYLGEYIFSRGELVSALTGFVAMGIAFLFSSFFFRKHRIEYTPEITGKE